MKVGIIGLPQTGKKTLFEVLTKYTFFSKDTSAGKIIKSAAEVNDPRFDSLLKMYNPKKQVKARIDIELLPTIEQDIIAKGDIFKDIAELDAICHVVRAFEDDSVYHVSGSVFPKRDIDTVNSELILNDLIFIDKRLERIESNLKRTRDASIAKEQALLLKLKESLDKELPLRLVSLDREEEKIISSYPFITRKKMIVVLNISEDAVKNTSLQEQLNQEYKSINIDIMQVCAKVESEISRLETEEEKKEFLFALGIEEPAINILTRLCMKALNLISFFTVGSDEVRQWTSAKGSTAPEAAGVIHTDLQRGFIRAEVMKYNDLITLGSEEQLKAAGKFYLKGKDYIVDDGDILNIRFNV